MKEAIPQSARPRGIHRRDVLAFTSFCLIFVLILGGLDALCYDDSKLSTTWKRIQSGDYPEVLIMGNSHAYTAFVPDIIEESTGLSCGIVASSSENMFFTLESFKTVLRSYIPRIVVLEAYTILSAEKEQLQTTLQEGMYRTTNGMTSFSDRIRMSFHAFRLDDVPVGVSQLFQPQYTWTRWETARSSFQSVTPKNRYKLIDVSGYRYLHTYTGGTITPDIVADFYESGYNNQGKSPIPLLDNEKAFVEFLELAEKNNITVLIVRNPDLWMVSDRIQQMNTVTEIAARYSCCKLVRDFHSSMPDMGLTREDFYDGGHLNRRGAVKFTTWFLDQHFLPQQPEPDYQPVFAYRTESVEPLGDGVYRYTMENFDADAQYRFRLGSETVQDWSSVNFCDVALDPASADKLYCDMLPGDYPEAERQILQLQLPFMKQNASVVNAPAA